MAGNTLIVFTFSKADGQAGQTFDACTGKWTPIARGTPQVPRVPAGEPEVKLPVPVVGGETRSSFLAASPTALTDPTQPRSTRTVRSANPQRGWRG